MPQYIIGGLLLLAAAAVAIGFAYLKLTAKVPPKLDAELCPVDGPTSMTIVLLDASDALPPIGRQQLATELTDLAEATPEYGLFELRVLEPNASGGAVKFRACNPGDGSSVDALTGNKELARRKWTQGFKQPLERALAADLAGVPSDNSPIMATIQAIAVERFTGARSDNVAKKLVIVSDMIENGRDYSQYRGDLSFARFKKSVAYKQFRTDLHGAEIGIKYVQRQKPPIDSVAHIRFWQEWIADNNGRFDSADRLQGVN
ncbi:hypothetical protein [Labrys sp. 22185]|uniref:hypothetical protein n=1 Tax=Labrys sp. 22185 TaxID=3453888 RepID=UPI003F87B4E5